MEGQEPCNFVVEGNILVYMFVIFVVIKMNISWALLTDKTMRWFK
jgi:hypothetical protein